MEGQKFTVFADHHPLTYLINVKDPYSRIAQWALSLQAFGMDIENKPGRANYVADALSLLTGKERSLKPTKCLQEVHT